MSHLTEEQEVSAYLGELPPALRAHLEQSSECRSRVDALSEMMNTLRQQPAPPRSDSYGAEVWARLLPKLTPKLTSPHLRPWWLRSWTLAPAIAALLVIAFLAGMLTQRQAQVGFSAQASRRVLLIALSDHLERSQIVLAQLLNSSPAELNIADERERARDLLTENRLLRQTAVQDGDAVHASLLEDLERVLLDIANSPSQVSPDDLVALRQRIDDESLLFKVRITSTDARLKGQKL